LFATDRTLLHTFPEFDLFRGVAGREYVGAFPPEEFGVEPHWPDVPGPRVFAYLQPSPNSRRLLAALCSRELSAVVYCPGLASQGPPLPTAPSIHYSTEPIAISQVARQCQIAITNGNLTTAAGFILAGKPQLLLPYTLEKYLTARCVELLGAGLAVAARDPLLETKLDAVLRQRDYARGAESFAARHAHWSAATQVRVLCQAIVDLTGGRPGNG
jgi:UDP:flavonoid glycosyltransferase YjiC (YdhE family)